MTSKRKIKYWYRRLRLNKEDELLRKYARKMSYFKYLNFVPKKQTWKTL
ncbi:MAG: hypothetical protein WC465_00325 [Patescibacteria group bacterium]